MASLFRSALMFTAFVATPAHLAVSVGCDGGGNEFETSAATGTGTTSATGAGDAAVSTGTGVGGATSTGTTSATGAGGDSAVGTASGGAGQGGEGQGGAGPGGAAQGGMGGGAIEQSCLDGIDDDDDGLPDCEDPDCASGFTCAPSAPPLWDGVGWLDASPSPPPCPADLAQTELYGAADLDAEPASCSCSCGPALGVDCGTHLRCAASEAQCAAEGPMNGQTTSCGTNLPNVNFPAFCRADPTGASGGACAVSTVGTPPPVEWAPETRACTTDAGGTCADAAAVCIPKLVGGVGPCITRVGDHVCPEPYADKVLYYDGQVADDRACAADACSCTAPVGSTCDCGVDGCAVELDSDGACAVETASVPTTGSCVPVQTQPASAQLVGATTVPGACASGGSSEPTGGVVPTGLVTVCCIP